jgi:hypothetical protein
VAAVAAVETTVTTAGTMTDRPQSSPGQTATPATAGTSRTAQSATVARGAHPLLGAFPLAVFTLATFLVIFALMMARLTAGADPALRAHPSTAVLTRSPGGAVLTTRTSGAVAAGATTPAVAGSERPPGARAAILTHASGAVGASEAGDD